jgi:hypothetical protein
MAEQAGARAFTYGEHIFLSSREKPTNLGLMAHETTHVLQQRGGPVLQMSGGTPASTTLEKEADTNAAHVVAGHPASTITVSPAGGRRFQGSFWKQVGAAVGRVAGAIAGGAHAIGSAAGSAFSAATRFLGRAAASAWSGLQSLGGDVLSWLGRASSAVWRAISWFGAKAWQGIRWLGTFLWEKLALLGTLAWSFLINLPGRFWRMVVHCWEVFPGVLGWFWTGLKSVAGWAWGAITGVFSWLGSGLGGAMAWLRDGLIGAGSWAGDFIQQPSVAKLWHGLLGSLSWFRRGVLGLVRWGANGIVAAALLVWQGIKGLARWLWGGLLGGLMWCAELLLYHIEICGFTELLQLVFGLIFRLRRLTGAEIGASLQVHVSGQVPYWQIRVDDDSILIRIGTTLARWFKSAVSPGAITTMHVLHFPKGGVPLAVVVHELTHVAQYERVGAIYMPQALHAQQSAAGYDYGNLVAARAAGKHFSGFNREQQASICEDYYKARNGLATDYGGTVTTLLPFITEMRSGRF